MNPAVAMILGWLLAEERLDFRAALAMMIILSAVVVVSLKGGSPRPTPDPLTRLTTGGPAPAPRSSEQVMGADHSH